MNRDAIRPHLSCSLVNAIPMLFSIAWYIAYCTLIFPVQGDDFGTRFVFYGLCVSIFQVCYSLMTFGFGTAGIFGSLFAFVVLMYAPVAIYVVR